MKPVINVNIGRIVSEIVNSKIVVRKRMNKPMPKFEKSFLKRKVISIIIAMKTKNRTGIAIMYSSKNWSFIK